MDELEYKTCPLRKSQVAEIRFDGAYGEIVIDESIRCARDKCGWWDEQRQQCAIVTMANR